MKSAKDMAKVQLLGWLKIFRS